MTGDDLVGHVSAAAPAHLDHVIGIGNSGLDQIIDTRQHIEMRVLKIVPDHVAQKRIAVAGASAIVGLQDGVALGGEHRHIILGSAEAELVGRLRTTVRLNGERIALAFYVIERIVKQAFNRDAVGAFPLDFLLARELETRGKGNRRLR